MSKFAIVDDEDFIIMSRMKWFVTKFKCNKFYPATYIDGKFVFMHRFIIKPVSGFEVDHINGNGLDNRKINLRACSHAQNMANRGVSKHNTSGFKGVSKCRGDDAPYFAYIQVNNKTKNLGRYKTGIEAAIAYDLAAQEVFGNFAKTNRSMGLLN